MTYQMKVQSASSQDGRMMGPPPAAAVPAMLNVQLVPVDANIGGFGFSVEKTPDTIRQYAVDTVVPVTVG